MARSVMVVGLAFALSLPSVSAAAATRSFGEKISLTTPTKLKSVVAAPAEFEGKDVLVSGSIVRACEKKGCWMEVKTDANQMRVTFKDYGFFIPLGSAGKTARMQGRVLQKEISVADQRHYLEDAGAKPAEIAAVKAPKQELTFVASGVEIVD